MDSLQNQGKQESLWTKDFTKIGATNFFDSICIQVLITIFPLFLNAKGFNAATIGTVASLYTICAMIMRFTSGNLIDRVILGYVRDMLNFSLINFPVFNVADSFVVCGAILLVIYAFFLDRREENKHDSAS